MKLRDIADVPLHALTALDLDALYTELLTTGGRRYRRAGGPLSPRTVRYVHTVISKALSDGLRKGVVSRNVAQAASPPSSTAARAKEFTAWSPAELRYFLEAVADHPMSVMFRVDAMTGLRRGEGCGLRWSDIDSEASTLTVRRSVANLDDGPTLGDVKTKRSRRTVDLDDQTLSALEQHRRAQLEHRALMGDGYRDLGLVFAGIDGTVVNPDRVGVAFDAVVRRLNVPTIRLHDLRHTHATHLLAAGVNAKIVSERLGHSSVAFTLDTYGHVLPGQQREAASAVAALVDGSSRIESVGTRLNLVELSADERA